MMKLKQLAEKCGKSVPFIMTVQKSFGLPILKEYSTGYAALMCKLIWLQIAFAPKKLVQTQLAHERKLLELLKVDSLVPSPSWFEDLCREKWKPGVLLLSGYCPGHTSGVQAGLDFSERETELFGSTEMGDDVLRALKLCIESQEAILARLRQEIPVLSDGLKWMRKVNS